MSLTAAQLEARDGKLTGSVVSCLMTGDKAKQMKLWRMLVGDPTYKADDLRDVWAVQLGSTTEQLNLDWYERTTHHEVTRRGEVVVHPVFPWAAATLDGFDAVLEIPVEAKQVGGFESRQVILDRYQPQCFWQMIVLGAKACAISIIEGAKKPAIEKFFWDQDYGLELLSRAQQFMQCVWTMTPPCAA